MLNRPVCDCGAELAAVLDDPSRHLSSHRTSRGIVTYSRCWCGRPTVALLPALRRRTAAPDFFDAA